MLPTTGSSFFGATGRRVLKACCKDGVLRCEAVLEHVEYVESCYSSRTLAGNATQGASQRVFSLWNTIS